MYVKYGTLYLIQSYKLRLEYTLKNSSKYILIICNSLFRLVNICHWVQIMLCYWRGAMKHHTCYFTIVRMMSFFSLSMISFCKLFLFFFFSFLLLSVLVSSLSCFRVLLIYCMFFLLNVDPRKSSCCLV